MSTVNYTNPNTDRTVRVFDNFNNFEIFVQSEEYDVVFSYFKSIYTDTTAAANFSVTLFRIANQQSVPVLTLLNQIQSAKSTQELDVQMAYLLNNTRSNSTLLGSSQPVTPNFYAARNVRA